MSDKDEKSSSGLSSQVVKLDELFQAVFGAARLTPHTEPNPPAMAAAGAYEQYVQQLIQRLGQDIQHVLAQVRDEQAIARMAGELLNAENSRKSVLQPYLDIPVPPGDPAGWPALVSRMRQAMCSELETIRDSRLRLELFRAELINQQRGRLTARIVLRGGAQIRLHFGRKPDHAAQKG